MFLFFAVLGYIVILCVWGTALPDMFKQNLNYKIGSYGHMNTRLKDLQNVGEVDILFLGSSHVYRGLDPRIFEDYGFKVFNLGSSAQTPIQTELLLNRYLDILKPKLILFDVFPESFSNDGVESSLDIIANSKNDWESIKMALTINHLKTYNTLIYGFFRDAFKLNANFTEALVKDKDVYIKNGFVDKALAYNRITQKLTMEWSFDDKQLKAFETVLNLIKVRGIPNYLIQIPVTKNRYDGYQNIDLFDEFLNAKGDYYNFNELITLNDTLHFYDTQHLNSKGVALFDNLLIETLLKH